VSFYPLR